MFLDFEAESFYQFAMALFMEAGHVFTSVPEYYNHSSEEFALFDNKSDVSLSVTDRLLLKRFNNISRLFTVEGCAFFSINLMTRRSERSEFAHDIHNMLHPIIDAEGTIFLFRYEDEVMLSFMGYGYRCILSDWYSIFDPYEQLVNRLDIINMNIESNRDYFVDLIYSLARDYYFTGNNSSVYSLIPVDLFTQIDRDEITREEFDEIIRENMLAASKQYGDDYVAYNETTPTRSTNLGMLLDLMVLETDMIEDNPFGEDTENDDLLDLDEEDSEEHDEYEFADVDPNVFKDPTLLVKLLKKQDLSANRQTD